MSSRGVNKCILVGNCGKDPETRYTPSGAAVTNISIATKEEWRDKNSGEKQSRTEWHNVVFFGKLAEIAGEYLKKGSQVYVEGSLNTEKWTDKSGNDRYTTKIKASEMQMLGSRGDQNGRAQQNSGAQQRAKPNQSYNQNTFDKKSDQSQQQPAPHQQGQSGSDADFSDDIPF